jgi:hypothetical protein
VGFAMLEELLRKLEALEDEEMDYLEKMKLQFEIQDLIAAEELKQLLDEQ